MITKIISIITNFLGGGIVKDIGEQLNRAYERKLAAKTNNDILEADKEIAYLTAKRDLLMKEQDGWITRLIRPAFALPFIVYNMKIIIWDKVLRLGSTDPLSDNLYQVQMIVIGFYFLTRGIEKMIVKSRR